MLKDTDQVLPEYSSPALGGGGGGGGGAGLVLPAAAGLVGGGGGGGGRPPVAADLGSRASTVGDPASLDGPLGADRPACNLSQLSTLRMSQVACKVRATTRW